ncbi:zinc finger, CCHC-type containing protein, partial [Tanacetum coccineum]
EVVRLPNLELKSLGERGIECIFVGYAEHSNAFSNEVPKVCFLKKAINDEMDFIMGNNTWVLADVPPGCKWIFKRKLNVDQTIEKFKARIVIQGFRQKSGIDYFDTYTPVVHISTIRLLIALASIHSLIIHQMDVKTAFLDGKLDEVVNMNQHQGFIMHGNKDKVCKLIKSLYRLKQAPKKWHQKFDEVVLSNDYLLNQADKCVYSKFNESSKRVIICLYVDDMLIFGTDQVQVDLTKEFLSLRFSMKYMEEADVILVSTPMDTSGKLMLNNGLILLSVGKLSRSFKLLALQGLLVAKPTNLEGAFALARVTKARLDDQRVLLVSNMTTTMTSRGPPRATSSRIGGDGPQSVHDLFSFGERHGYVVSSLMDTAYWSSQ